MLMTNLNVQQDNQQNEQQLNISDSQQQQTVLEEEESLLLSSSSGTVKEVLSVTTPPSSKSTSPLQQQQQHQSQHQIPQQQQQQQHQQQHHQLHQQHQLKHQQQQLYANNLNIINQQLLLNNLKQHQHVTMSTNPNTSNPTQQQQQTATTTNATSTGNDNYYLTFNGYKAQTAVDINSLNHQLHHHSYLTNQTQQQQQQQQQNGFINFTNGQQLQQQQQQSNAAALNAAYSMINNPYLNIINGTQTAPQQTTSSNHQTSPTNVVSAANNAGLIASFNAALNGYNSNGANGQTFINLNGQTTAITSNGQLLNTTNNNNNNNNPQTINLNDEHQVYEYLHQLLDEKEKIKELFNEPLNILLPISARLLDEEISRIRVNLFQLGGKESVCLPEPIGTPLQMTEKLYVPVKDHPEFNFVGRILGPRGMTAKQLEQETGCKIMVRGKGSMRDKAKEEQMKGKPNWEHLNDELHVLITVEDTKNRAEVKLKRAVEEIKRLLVPAPEGEDELKKKQLMELAIINGTYRDGSKIQQKMNQILIPNNGVSLAQAVAAANNGLRSPPNPLGQPLIISPRLAGSANPTHQLIASSTDPSTGGLIYTTIPAIYSDHHAAALNANLNASQALLDYPNGIEFSQAGSIKTQRYSTVNSATMRAHPYARVALS